MNEKELNEYLNGLTDSIVDKKRVFKIIAGCKTYGYTDLQIGNLCNDPECITCSNFRKSFEYEVKKYGNSK